MENRLDTPSSERSALSRRGLLGAAGATGLAAGMLATPGLASASTRRRTAGSEFTVGCSFPLTGPLASDGEQMKNGVTLAADEINAAGGIAGKQIKLSIVDTDVTDPAKIKTSLQKHVNDKVDALYEGYLIQWPASMDIKANYGAPSLNASTSIDQVKQIQQLGQVREHLPDRPARVVLRPRLPRLPEQPQEVHQVEARRTTRSSSSRATRSTRRRSRSSASSRRPRKAGRSRASRRSRAARPTGRPRPRPPRTPAPPS